MADKKTIRDEAPPPHDEGQFAAVCVDVIDLGFNVEKYQDQPAELKDKTALVFQTENAEGEDKPRYIAQEFATSMGKKSNLRKFLEAWRGKPYTEDEARKQGIPLDKLEGVPCLVTVAHKTSLKGNLHAVIQSIMPLPKQMREAVPSAASYKRPEFWEKKKTEYAAAVAEYTAKNTKASKATDVNEFDESPDDTDDLPF